MNVTISKMGDSKYRVSVEDGGSETEHEVTVTAADVARYAPGSTPEKLLGASFEFLLERESNDEILRRFDLPMIERYFPEYGREIKKRVR